MPSLRKRIGHKSAACHLYPQSTSQSAEALASERRPPLAFSSALIPV
ncbi:uncharacterized protein J3R85_003846 [Psidium guajava]|nr:uncharacterized protein J3R85_003846 [Psidium guajava]